MSYDFRNRLATHQPVLWEVGHVVEGPHEIAERRRLRLVTLDNNESWLERFRPTLQSEWHEFRLVEDWDTEPARPNWDAGRALVVVDQKPFEARARTVERLQAAAEYVVVHDDDYFAEHGLFGVSIRPLLGQHDRAERDFGDTFSSWREVFPPEPGPFRPTGPPTLLGSNLPT